MNFGLIGEKLGHSFSLPIHQALGLYEYEICPISRENLDDFLTKREFRGINVTIPYKRDVIPYLKEISPARTFGFEEEIAYLQANGLAKGGNLENCVVIKKDGFSVPLRFDNEMVRHKILDIIGDLKLTGKILGPMHITCKFGGHKTNVAFAKKLTEQNL